MQLNTQDQPRLFVVQENVSGRWITLAKIACPDKTAAHLQELKAVAPEPVPGQRYLLKELAFRYPRYGQAMAARHHRKFQWQTA